MTFDKVILNLIGEKPSAWSRKAWSVHGGLLAISFQPAKTVPKESVTGPINLITANGLLIRKRIDLYHIAPPGSAQKMGLGNGTMTEYFGCWAPTSTDLLADDWEELP